MARPSHPGRKVPLLPFRFQQLQFSELALGQGVVQAEGNEVGGSVLPPMGKMALVDREGFIRMQPLKARGRREVPHGAFLGRLSMLEDGSGEPSYVTRFPAGVMLSTREALM